MVTLDKGQEKLVKPYLPDFKHDKTLHDLSHRNLEDLDITLVLTAYGGLDNLNFSNNLLTSIPETFCIYVSHVQILDLSNNKITRLPDNFGELRNLRTLILYNNKLKQLPLSFGKLDKLNWLELIGNPLDHTLKEVCGPDLSLCRHVAWSVREFYFLLQYSLSTCPELHISGETYAKVTGGNATDWDNANGDSRSTATRLDSSDFKKPTEKIQNPLIEKHQTEFKTKLKLLKRKKWSERHLVKNSPTARTFFGSFYVRKIFPIIALLGIPFLLFFLLSIIRGPPELLLRYGKFRYPAVVPAVLMETLAWLHVCTLYPLRKYFSCIDSCTNIFITPPGSSWTDFLTKWF